MHHTVHMLGYPEDNEAASLIVVHISCSFQPTTVKATPKGKVCTHTHECTHAHVHPPHMHTHTDTHTQIHTHTHMRTHTHTVCSYEPQLWILQCYRSPPQSPACSAFSGPSEG